ncbi:MAG TPA: hypothetical protein VHY08_08350 [Bacillota bacterium]|nr:hypothetical protein [Bacillota bacterium]
MRLGNLFKKIFTNKIFWGLFFLIIMDLAYINWSALVLKEPALVDNAGNRAGIRLPYKQKASAGDYVFTGKIFYHGFLSANLVQIIPSDEVLSIRINNQDVPLNQVSPAALRDPIKGFHFPLGRYLQNGVNEVEIRIRNNDIHAGLILQNSAFDVAHVLLMVLILAMLYLILSMFISNKVFIFIILGGFLIRVLYFLITPYNVREYDVDGHIQYIQYILNHWSIPSRNYGWETFQPPLYYFAAAFVYKTFVIFIRH